MGALTNTDRWKNEGKNEGREGEIEREKKKLDGEGIKWELGGKAEGQSTRLFLVSGRNEKKRERRSGYGNITGYFKYK